jgi:hypothetical protein
VLNMQAENIAEKQTADVLYLPVCQLISDF